MATFPGKEKEEMHWLQLTAKTAETGALWANFLQAPLFKKHNALSFSQACIKFR